MTKVTNYQREVANWTEFSLATVSLVCALLTLLTVAFMKSWNGYIALICSMVFFQILYDINFILGVCPGYAACVTWNFLDVLGGLSVSFWSNAISFVIMITVVKTRSFNVFKNYWKFSFFAIVLPLVVAIMAMFVIVPASSDDDEPFTYCAYRESTLAEVVGGLYYWGRILSIIFNVGVFAYTSARINGMRITPPIPRQGSDVTGSDRSVGMRPSRRQDISTENQNMAVYTLISRIKYYPIAQVISRSGACWNAFDNYKFSTYPSVMFNAVTGPILGLLCFIIFLVSSLHDSFVLSDSLQSHFTIIGDATNRKNNSVFYFYLSKSRKKAAREPVIPLPRKHVHVLRRRSR